jgi:hypothetical protein
MFADRGARWPRGQCVSACNRGSKATVVSHWMDDQKNDYVELLRALEGTLSRWSRLHLQSLAPSNPNWARVVGYGKLCIPNP